MRKPKVSIVVPCHNEESRILRCLGSIKDQSYSNIEIVVVDNNSTDATKRMASSVSGVVVVEEKRQGIVFARDTGFSAATVDIIARIDADTILPTDWVQKIVDYSDKHKDVSWAITGPGFFYNAIGSGMHAMVHSLVYYHVNRVLLGYYLLWGSNMAMSTSAWKLVRGEVCQIDGIHEDMDLAAHLHMKGVAITYDKKLLASMELKRMDRSAVQLWRYLMKWAKSLGHHNTFAGYACYPVALLVWLFGVTVGPALVFLQGVVSTGKID